MPTDRSRKGTILVTDSGRGSAIAFLRSLGRQGWRVIAADADSRSAGFRSRYAARHMLYPNPAARPEDFVAALIEGVRSQGVQLIVPITDEAILPLSRSRRSFDGLCTLALPEADALERVGNKLATLELAESLGVPAPRSRLVHTSTQALAEAEHFRWPIVLKPQRSRVYHSDAAIEVFEVAYAPSREQLAEQMRRFEGRCAVLLQEYVEGTGYGVEILADAGRPLAAFQHRRLHELPIQGGRSALRESTRLDPALYDHAVRLLGALEWTGLAMVEFRVGPRGAALMEINGRVWGSLPLAVQSGMDFPRRLAELYLLGPPGPEVPTDQRYRVGVRVANLERELKWIASLLLGWRLPFLPSPRRREALRATVGLLDPRARFDIQSLDDPRPGLADFAYIVRGFGDRLRRRPAATR
jgi:predicted ATP-grasp superfamily ATP-dependent carboligase